MVRSVRKVLFCWCVPLNLGSVVAAWPGVGEQVDAGRVINSCLRPSVPQIGGSEFGGSKKRRGGFYRRVNNNLIGPIERPPTT